MLIETSHDYISPVFTFFFSKYAYLLSILNGKTGHEQDHVVVVFVPGPFLFSHGLKNSFPPGCLRIWRDAAILPVVKGWDQSGSTMVPRDHREPTL